MLLSLDAGKIRDVGTFFSITSSSGAIFRVKEALQMSQKLFEDGFRMFFIISTCGLRSVHTRNTASVFKTFKNYLFNNTIIQKELLAKKLKLTRD